jgi:hypothetical protein
MRDDVTPVEATADVVGGETGVPCPLLLICGGVRDGVAAEDAMRQAMTAVATRAVIEAEIE